MPPQGAAPGHAPGGGKDSSLIISGTRGRPFSHFSHFDYNMLIDIFAFRFIISCS